MPEELCHGNARTMGRQLAFCLSALLLAVGPTEGADAGVEALEQSFTIESRLFDSEVQRYRAARREEKKLLSRIIDLTEKVDAAIEEPSLDIEELWSLEDELESAQARLASVSEKTVDYRRTIYRNLERLIELGSAIEHHLDRSLVETEKLDGRWRIEMSPSNELGLMDLRLDGTLVTGAYRLSSGAQGSIRGTYTNHRLALERVDTLRGADIALTGMHDPLTGEIQGTWEAMVPTDISGSAGAKDSLTGEVRNGWQPRGENPRNIFGRWTARKISPAEERGILSE